MKRRLPLAALGLLGLSLGACTTNVGDKLNELGEKPAMSKITDPTKEPGYQPVTMPVPTPVASNHQNGSIWQPGARAFFKDQRASRVGDVLTVNVTINDSAIMANETKGQRNDSDQVAMNNFLGLEKIAPKVLTPSSLINTSGVRNTDGKATINRQEQITVQLAAIVTQVLPNGNLVVSAKQEVRVDYDLRDVSFSGVVRPTDIDATNTIAWNQIADARLSYSGRGQSEDLQQPRMGSQLIDILSPF
ncbi:MAG: flagellar basal body L-ring protein FlgH [Aliidongia sp.]